MRILVTKQGNIIIQDIDTPAQFFGSSIRNSTNNNLNRGYSTGQLKYTRKINSKFLTSSSKTTKSKNKLINQNLRSFSTMRNKLKKIQVPRSIEEGEFTKEEIEDAKIVKIKNKKIGFPTNFIEKYERDAINTKLGNNNSFLPTLTSKIQENNNVSSGMDNFINKEKYLSFGEIIPKNTVRKMEKEILTDRINKEKDYKLTENNFRTYYEPETDIQKFKNVLNNSKLNINKASLIKYLKEKKLNPLMVKNLSYYDNNKINKINKMCQIYFQNEDKDKLFNDLIKNKIKQQINGTKKEFQNCIHDLGKNINIINEKLEKYDKKVDDRERYRDQFNDIVTHYWRKRDYERLNKKSTPKMKYMHSFFEGEEDETRKNK